MADRGLDGGLRAFVLLLVLARSATTAAAPLQLIPYQGPIRVRLEEKFVDGKLRIMLTLRTPDLTGCGSLATSVTRTPTAISISIAGISRDSSSLMCVLMDPPAPSARFDLTNDAGHRTLTLRLGERADNFALDIAPTEIGIAPIGKQTFVDLAAEGKMLRLPPNVMWVFVSYSDEAARKRFRPEAEALVQALTAVGAKPITLPAGKYAAPYVALPALDPEEPPPSFDTYYFQYEGTFETLANVGRRWKRYDRRHGAYMSTNITDPHGRTFYTR